MQPVIWWPDLHDEPIPVMILTPDSVSQNEDERLVAVLCHRPAAWDTSVMDTAVLLLRW